MPSRCVAAAPTPAVPQPFPPPACTIRLRDGTLGGMEPIATHDVRLLSDEAAGVRRTGGSQPASVLVYATATGLAAAIPVPLLDGVFSELARGSAMRRVALRHGVVMTPGAREILSGSGTVQATTNGRGRLLKAALASALAPLRVAARLEDAAGTLFSAVLLDRFLGRPDRAAGAALTEAEALRVRAAVDRAVTETGFDVLRTLPLGAWDVLNRAIRGVFAADDEARQPVERFVDGVLDGLADAPAGFWTRLVAHFDVALDEESR
ncbi:MAG: hypothetical protein ACFCGT_17420 [Sandaracinaceae bacterium]